MTFSDIITVSANVDVISGSVSSVDKTHSDNVLPRPIGAHPEIIDSGRIKFGASARLPVSR